MSSPRTTTLANGVRLHLDMAKSQAEHNIKFLSDRIAKSEREIESRRIGIEADRKELAENEASLAQAEALLNG